MNRIGILDGYGDYGAHQGKGKHHRKSRRRKTSQQVKFSKAAKSCARRRTGSFKVCMKKKLKKKGRR